MTEHDPPPAADASPAIRPVLPVPAAEEARRPALALLDRLREANAITPTELSRGRTAILGGELDELLLPPLGAEAPPPTAGAAQGPHPAGRHSIGDYLREGGALG